MGLKGRDIKAFVSFRRRIYRGDPQYAGTAEFILDMLLRGGTNFSRQCEILPVAYERGGVRAAQALFIVAPREEFAQLAFFDCFENDVEAAEAIILKARELTRARNLKKLVAGLNAHLSYGVGILTETSLKNTFDTCYNKTYYANFFSGFPVRNTLTAYRNTMSDSRARLGKVTADTRGYTVRKANFKRFREECERMRVLCDDTIGETYLYSRTEPLHFYELLKDMKLILHENNLLFLMHGGKEVGFLFWHPDFNGAVKAGKPVSAFSFALACAFGGKKIDTVKLNSIGVEREHRGLGTLALLRAMSEAVGDRFKYIETNFVWDCNRESSFINRRLIGGECRKFAVYEYPEEI